MNAQHTPGPWRVTGPNVRAGGALLAVVTDHWADEKTPDDVKAHNAHLIASAPDMLAALREAVRVLEYAADALDAPAASHFRETISDVRAAIAKAEGIK